MIAPVSGASRKGEPRIPVEDRLFSLVLALLATEAGLLKAEILSSVRGYAERYDDSGHNANLERQFERDKDDIRELGIPLETVESPDRPGDNQALRYRIPKGLYDLPDEVRFTPDELALLGLAARGVARGLPLGRLAARAHEAALARHRAARTRDRLRPAAARARRRLRAAAAGARPSPDGALPLLQARRGRHRANAPWIRSPSCCTRAGGTCTRSTVTRRVRARSCSRASSDPSSPCPA